MSVEAGAAGLADEDPLMVANVAGSVVDGTMRMASFAVST
jgi:hypothetical protein